MARIIDGKAIAAKLTDEVATQVAAFQAETGIVPTLAVVLVGEDAASQVYVGRKLKATRKAGIGSAEHRLGIAFFHYFCRHWPQRAAAGAQG